MTPHKIWIEQCEAATGIEDEFGTDKALAYLIGEKFINFLEAAEADVAFRGEIPAFVAEIKSIFEPWQLAEYLDKARQTEPFDAEDYDDPEEAEMERQLELRKSAAELLLVERAREWLLGERLAICSKWRLTVTKALLVIDLQNDYFPGGKFPLWNTDVVLQNIERAIAKANAQGVPVVHIQHVAKQGMAPFFNEVTLGVEIHPRILTAAPKAPVIVKEFADGFEKTNLEETLAKLGVTELLVCGMMTQNCVTHTAISKAAEKYNVTILPDCCTTVSEILHLIALHAVSTRVKLVPSSEAL